MKASWEANSAVGDRTNDAVRVDGRDLRCKVVGEGGNLGLSQLGRVEFALRGGRINTDFVDNSGGVDCSDHEVNIKILLKTVQERTRLTTAARDRLLATMTDDVGQLVLRDNYLQSQAISLLQATAPERLGEHAHFIRSLELDGVLDRAIEYLPSAEEIEDRRKAGLGLVRPEIAMMLSYAKIALSSQLIQSDVPEDPYLGQELDRYFPPRLAKKYGELLGSHRLRREIIVTATTNSIVNRMGPTFVARTQQDTGADVVAVARAYSIAREVFDVREMWRGIEALDNKVAASVQYGMVGDTIGLIRQATYWLIQRHRTALEHRAAGCPPAARHPGTRRARRCSGCEGSDRSGFETRAGELARAGVPADLIRRIAACHALQCAPDIVELAQSRKLTVDGRRQGLLRHRRAFRPRLAAHAHRGPRCRGSLARRRARQPARGAVRSAPQPGAGRARIVARERPGQGRGEMARIGTRPRPVTHGPSSTTSARRRPRSTSRRSRSHCRRSAGYRSRKV